MRTRCSGTRHDVRNAEWFHMYNSDILSMPDKWDNRGMPHGTWPFTRWRSRSWTSISRRASCCCC